LSIVRREAPQNSFYKIYKKYGIQIPAQNRFLKKIKIPGIHPSRTK